MRNGKCCEYLAGLTYDLLDLCRVVVGAVLVSAWVDDRVARAFEQRSKGAANSVAVGVVRPHDSDLLVRADLRPEMGVREKELEHAEAVVERPFERRRLPDIPAPSAIPRLPAHHRRAARHAGGLACVRNRVDCLRSGSPQQQADLLVWNECL